MNTSAGVRQNAVDFALSKVGLDYNYQFWSNKVVNAVAYNCSQLIWAAYYEASGMSVDLDSNKGTGVYPLDIRASSKVTPYR
ncbi:YiiX/YebB-like N1pC/P60 family cysteine hydrolase [Rhodococcus erythropolis]